MRPPIIQKEVVKQAPVFAKPPPPKEESEEEEDEEVVIIKVRFNNYCKVTK